MHDAYAVLLTSGLGHAYRDHCFLSGSYTFLGTSNASMTLMAATAASLPSELMAAKIGSTISFVITADLTEGATCRGKGSSASAQV